jgi:electron transfer flavoprotein alpha subunit
MTTILILAEHDGSHLNAATAKCVTSAQSIDAATIDILVCGDAVDAVAAEASAIQGVSRVRCLPVAADAISLAAVLAPAIAEIASDYSHVFGPSTTFGKDVMPRVAALMGVNQISDIMEIESTHRFKRPIYAGNAILTVEAPADAPVVATIRVASYQAAGDGGSATVETVDNTSEDPGHTRFVGLQSGDSDRPDLQTAAKVVSGGRALASSDNFDLIYALADKLGAGVGASRAAVDAGYVPNEMQVGQTGKIIAPDLYIAIGISGAIQHLTGIKDAGTIVAINKDEEAPIFEVADIGLVGDLFKLVPELTDALP